MLGRYSLRAVVSANRLSRSVSTFPYAFGGLPPAKDNFDPILRELFKTKYLSSNDLPGFWKAYHTLLEAIEEGDKEFLTQIFGWRACTENLAKSLSQGLDDLKGEYQIGIQGEGKFGAGNNLQLCYTGFKLMLDDNPSKQPHWLIPGQVPVRLGIVGMDSMNLGGLMRMSSLSKFHTAFEVIIQMETDKNLTLKNRQGHGDSGSKSQTHRVSFSIISKQGSLGMSELTQVMMAREAKNPREQLVKLIEAVHGNQYNWMISGLDTTIPN